MKTEKLTGYSSSFLQHKKISVLIRDSKFIYNEIKKMQKDRYKSFSCRVHINTAEKKEILIDMKVSCIKDKAENIIGFLLIGSEIKNKQHLRKKFGITDRELEVIQFLLLGLTYREIAGELGITERTIKAHMTHIYNKICVNNKFQLLSFLNEYNLVPQKSSERIIFT
jgi:DNA-binding CsgD family transcriptional regulator